jgi:hypothetical protein
MTLKDYFLKNRNSLEKKENLINIIINPFTPIFLCEYHYGVDDLPFSKPPHGDYYNFRQYLLQLYSGTDKLLKQLNKDNVGELKGLTLVSCQTDKLESFLAEIVPLLKTKIILFTHKDNLPPVYRNHVSDAIKNNPMIAHWFSQNPIYQNDDTYTGFPFGIREHHLVEYADAMVRYNGEKTISIQHLCLNYHTNPIRAIFPKVPPLDLRTYYDKISQSKFLISPPGDRPDCYRHYEAIGLGCIPISNIDKKYYYPIFGDRMFFTDSGEEMLNILNENRVLEYVPPDRNMIFCDYWKEIIKQTIEKLLKK